MHEGRIWVSNLPRHAEVAGAGNRHRCVGQSSEEQLVETGADVSILPHRERILVICVTEAGDQIGWPIRPHASAGFTPIALRKYLKK